MKARMQTAVLGVMMLCTLLLLSAAPVRAQTPTATGRVLYADNLSQFATWEFFDSTVNVAGFFLRIWTVDTVSIVEPFEVNPDGSIRCSFIEYSYAPGNPLDTTFWTKWYSGEILLATVGPNGVEGVWTWMTEYVGDAPVAINPPDEVAIIFAAN